MIGSARTLLLCLLAVLAACSSKPKVPEGILPPHRMTTVLREVLTADEWVQYRRDYDSAYARPDSSIALYRGVLQRHRISEADFKKSFRYYEGHPELLKKILDDLEPPAPIAVDKAAPAKAHEPAPAQKP